MVQVYIGIGCNLGNREQHIEDALDSLKQLAQNGSVSCSPLYETAPMGPQDQPDYVNAVCAFDSHLPPLELLAELQRIETKHGRNRDAERWTARPLDLDLLLYGDEVIRLPTLVVPHPGIAQRSFVLWPLADLQPELTIPGLGPVADLRQQCQRFGIKRLHSRHMKHQFIAVEGPIGVGKTTLANILVDELNAYYLHDTDKYNPYLEAFYEDPAAVAMHTQLHFLVSRLDELHNPAVLKPAQPIVADFLIDKDRLFAELTLSEQEWGIYTRLFDRLVADSPKPDLVIYLQAPLERLIERIERRGVKFEQHIDSHYLQQLIAIYERFFHSYSESPLLIVNAADINLVDNPADVARLLEQIQGLEGGRHYFNPQANTA